MPIIKRSRFPFSETMSRLLAAIVRGGNTVFTTIDQTAAAANVGLTLRPPSLIVFGNPKGGTALMEAFPLVALDLPLKMLVWDADDAVQIAYTQASELASRHHVRDKEALIAAMDVMLGVIADSVA